MNSKALTYREYTVGWVCALPKELAAATVMLDEQHPDLPRQPSDENAYTLGSIDGHNIAIACLPMGDIGNNPAATVATRMTSTFPSIRFWLMVGIGGGVPPKVRLGDIVVSTPVYDTPGLIQWDLGITQQDNNFKRIGALDKAPEALRTAITKLRAQHEIRGHDTRLLSILGDIRSKEPTFALEYLQSENLEDVLFRADYNHVSQIVQTADDRDEEDIDNDDDDDEGEEDGISNCRHCDRTKAVKRKLRKLKTKIHYGLVASGNQVIKDAVRRDEINKKLEGNVLCFEMEAAGITISHPCLVIRGICDYADTHKNYNWQRYAAVIAAAFAKELLGVVAPNQVNVMPPAAEVLNELKDVKHTTELNLEATHKIDTNFILSKLSSVNEAAFNSFSNQSEPMCHPETRIALLSEVNEWALDSQSKCIFWLNGMAGTGKSTISRTVARDFTQCRQLGASFFFKRGEGDRGNASKFFTTIATQLVYSLPDLRPYLKRALEMDPAISTMTMKEQFERLIFEPLSKLARPLKTLIVIDALDECENEVHITIILHLLARIQFIESIKLRLLVTSRPDLPLRLGFKQIPESHRDFILHEIPRPVIEHDIGAFLRDELPEIRDKYNCLPPSGIGIPLDWPSERNLQALIKMAVPLFIFAATMCRFIGETWDWDPVGNLLKVMHYQSAGSLTQLEKTYLPVLTQILEGDITESEKEDRIQQFRDIVGSIVILFEPLSTTSLAIILGKSKILVDNRLHRLHSVLRVPADPKSAVRLFHLSFRDFLIDPERKRSQFWVDETETHQKTALRCLDLLSKTDCLKEDICSLEKPGVLRIDIDRGLIEQGLPAEVQYACRYWVHHMKQGSCQISDQDQVHIFLEQRFLYWLEALSLLGRIADSVSMIATLQTLIKPGETRKLAGFLNDAKRFILSNKALLDRTPLQLYSSAIIFAPETSIIRNTFQTCILRWLKRLPRVQKAWNATLQTIEGHLAAVYSIAFSPDGRQLASCSGDETIKLWDATTGDLQQTIECHSDSVWSIAFSPDGKQLASSSHNKEIKLWDTTTGDLQQKFESHLELGASIAFSPDGRQLASGFSDRTIKLWDTVTGNLQQIFESHSKPISSIAFSPDSKQLASGSYDKTIKLWDATTGDLQQILKSHSKSINSIAFSPNGRQLASGSDDKTIKLWDATTGDLQQTIEGHSDSVWSIAFSPDGTQLASGSGDKTIKLWDTVIGNLQQIFEGHSALVFSIAFSPNSTQLASGSGDGTIRLYDTVIGNLQQTFESHSKSINSIVFSPNGRQLASGSDNKTIRLWDTITGDLQQTIEGHLDPIYSIAFSPNGKQLASGSYDETIKLWDIVTGNLQQILKGYIDAHSPIVFSPNSKQLALGSRDGIIKLWDITTGDLQQTFEGYLASVYSIAFSPNGTQLASGSGDGTIRLYNTVIGNLQQTFESHSKSINSIAFSPNGKQLASGSDDKTIKLWDATTGDLQQTIEGHLDPIYSIAFPPDGKQLASGSDDERIRDALYLITDRGSIRVQRSEMDDDSAPCYQRNCLSFDHNWITYGNENIISLPPEYRVVKSNYCNEVLALGHDSGLITLFEISEQAKDANFPRASKRK